MGSKEEEIPVEPVEKTVFAEDLTESELATAVSSKYLNNRLLIQLLILPEYAMKIFFQYYYFIVCLEIFLCFYLIGNYISIKFLTGVLCLYFEKENRYFV